MNIPINTNSTIIGGLVIYSLLNKNDKNIITTTYNIEESDIFPLEIAETDNINNSKLPSDRTFRINSGFNTIKKTITRNNYKGIKAAFRVESLLEDLTKLSNDTTTTLNKESFMEEVSPYLSDSRKKNLSKLDEQLNSINNLKKELNDIMTSPMKKKTSFLIKQITNLPKFSKLKNIEKLLKLAPIAKAIMNNEDDDAYKKETQNKKNKEDEYNEVLEMVELFS